MTFIVKCLEGGSGCDGPPFLFRPARDDQGEAAAFSFLGRKGDSPVQALGDGLTDR